MSLTILVHRKRRDVGIVRWFLDPKVSISYATGPLTRMPEEEFRNLGWNWIRRHFEEYSKVRLSEQNATDVFVAGEEKIFLKDRDAVRIKMEDSGEELTLIPQTFAKCALAQLESLDKEARRTIPINSPSHLFWKTFDEVLAIASET